MNMICPGIYIQVHICFRGHDARYIPSIFLPNGQGLKRAFGVALAEQSYVSDESRFWQRWTQGRSMRILWDFANENW